MSRVYKGKLYAIALCAIAVATFTASPSLAANLIPNSSLETASAADPTMPDQWLKGNFGNNTAVFTYPVAGVNGGKAAKIDISAFTDGDAKWYFPNVPVASGKTYVFQDKYMSDVPTTVAIQYTNNAGVTSYDANFLTVAASPNDWGTATVSFTPGPGITQVTVFHYINSVGNLTVDEFSLDESAVPLGFSEGMVSLSFDDGFNSQYINAKPILDAAGIKSTFNIITHVAAGFSVANPSFETADSQNPQLPMNWTNNVSGENDATFAYPAAGIVGARAASVSITNFVSGDAGWQHSWVSVLPDMVYQYNSQYKSEGATSIVAEIQLADGSTTAASLVDDAGNSLDPAQLNLAAAANWTPVKFNFYLPPEAKYLRVSHKLNSVGSLTIDDVSIGGFNYMTHDEVLNLQNGGQEIGSHSQTHADLTILAADSLQTEVAGSYNDLTGNGVSSLTGFTFPYGNTNDAVKQALISAGYKSGRTVNTGYNSQTADPYNLATQSIDASTTIEQVKTWIDRAKADKTWLILTLHDVAPDVSQIPYGTTPAMLQQIVDYIKGQNIKSVRVDQGAALLGSSTGTPVGTVSITFNPGWNLITLPLLPSTNHTADTLGNLVGADVLASWNPATQQYVSHITNLPLDNFSVGLNQGVFVHVTSSKSIVFSGNAAPQSTPQIASGWNMLGWNDTSATTAANYAQKVTGADVIAKYDSLSGTWLSHIAGQPLNNYTISRGDGIFVHKP